MLRPRLQYNSSDIGLDDIFISCHTEKTTEVLPIKSGCIPPFFTRFMQWLNLWKVKKTDDNDYVDIIDEMV